MTELQRKNREDKIIAFLKERDCISIGCIEKQANIPLTTIAQVKTGKRKLPADHIEGLEKALKKYGYK